MIFCHARTIVITRLGLATLIGTGVHLPYALSYAHSYARNQTTDYNEQQVILSKAGITVHFICCIHQCVLFMKTYMNRLEPEETLRMCIFRVVLCVA